MLIDWDIIIQYQECLILDLSEILPKCVLIYLINPVTITYIIVYMKDLLWF